MERHSFHANLQRLSDECPAISTLIPWPPWLGYERHTIPSVLNQGLPCITFYRPGSPSCIKWNTLFIQTIPSIKFLSNRRTIMSDNLDKDKISTTVALKHGVRWGFPPSQGCTNTFFRRGGGIFYGCGGKGAPRSISCEVWVEEGSIPFIQWDEVKVKGQGQGWPDYIVYLLVHENWAIGIKRRQ